MTAFPGICTGRDTTLHAVHSVHCHLIFGMGIGLGIGVKKFRQVWVFNSKKALNNFINSGWEVGGQATAAAKSGSEGGDMAGAISVDTDILLYQLTDEIGRAHV